MEAMTLDSSSLEEYFARFAKKGDKITIESSDGSVIEITVT